MRRSHAYHENNDLNVVESLRFVKPFFKGFFDRRSTSRQYGRCSRSHLFTGIVMTRGLPRHHANSPSLFLAKEGNSKRDFSELTIEG